MSKTKSSLSVKVAFLALLIGISAALYTNNFVTREYIPKDSILDCAIAFPGPRTETRHGYPFTTNMELKNTCMEKGEGFRAVNFVANTALYSLIAFTLISLVRKKK
jgi:hypothetical protein